MATTLSETAGSFVRPLRAWGARIFSVLLVLSGAGASRAEDFASFDPSDRNQFDLVVYGGTPAGIMAAVAAGRGGSSVCLLESSHLIGGMMAGGLTKTDVGAADTIGGLSKEFYERVERYYSDKFGPDSKQVAQTNGGFYFEPKVAGIIFRRMLAEAGVTVGSRERLQGALVEDGRIRSISVRHSETDRLAEARGDYFVDATYEGDLLAAAGVPYRVGREARAEYGESLAGMNAGPEMYRGKGGHRVQAYNMRSTVSRDPENMIPFPKPSRYDPSPFENFVRSVNAHGITEVEDLFKAYSGWGWVNGKGDPNKADYVGANYAYAEGDYEQRARIVERVRDHWLSFWFMLQNDERLPEAFRQDAIESLGLPKDEFEESGHVSPQVYVRVARRMLGRYLLTQEDCEVDRWKEDGIALGSYNFDSHVVQEFLGKNRKVSEGYFIQRTDPYEIPYRILTPFAPKNLLVVCAVSATHVAYSTLRMEPVFMMLGQVGGLAVQEARESGGVAVQEISVDALRDRARGAGIPLQAPFLRPQIGIRVESEGSVRPGEPVGFEVVEKAVRAPLEKFHWNFDGSGSLDADTRKATHVFPTAQEYPVSLIVEDADGNLSLVETVTVNVVDDGGESAEIVSSKARLRGRWQKTRGAEPGYRYRVAFHDGNEDKGGKEAVFAATLPETGRYKVALAYPAHPNRANAVPVTVRHAGGTDELFLDQSRPKEAPFVFAPIGEFEFEKGGEAVITIRNRGTDGYVLADEARWIFLGE